MSVRRKPSSARPEEPSRQKERGELSSQPSDTIRQFVWAVAAVNARLEDVRHFWADALGISGPQWMIIMAADDLNRGRGAPLRDVATKLDVDPSFVASQSKILEKAGLLARNTSSEDARVIILSLTLLARKEISKLRTQQATLDEFIFADCSEREMQDIIKRLIALTKRLEKASLRLELES